MLTAIGSFGYYVIVVGAVYGGASWAFPVFAVFAAARAAPTFIAVHRGGERQVTDFTHTLIQSSKPLRVLEGPLFVALMAAML
jgi:uncharacterized membrane protein